MTPEVGRRHYLAAMGIASWEARYQLPNALATEACEWQDAPVATPPRERLQALLDDAPSPAVSRSQLEAPSAAPAPSEAARTPSAVRALLGDATPVTTTKPAADTPPGSLDADSARLAATPQAIEPLRFGLSCCCIEGRWLSLHDGELSPVEQRLLANMLQAAGVTGEALTTTYFEWPPMADTFAPQAPLAEAQEGVAAFIAGMARRHQWQLERVLWWGAEDSQLTEVLAREDGRSKTLELPVWHAPPLSWIAQSAQHKRTLWPRLTELGQMWRGEA